MKAALWTSNSPVTAFGKSGGAVRKRNNAVDPYTESLPPHVPRRFSPGRRPSFSSSSSLHGRQLPDAPT
ncbi:hypothetical protein E2C01_035900 [Portunus trituberculatus]|uniref:Uncharacterized protein n=1 Tax=Portunus trituberculatus TaxID=210409 RepID=A0A5B7F5K2_PORTR|nr:hypothetical protein [Portunus trituberculatus]